MRNIALAPTAALAFALSTAFPPRLVSPTGAERIARFLPGTASFHHLSDPFDPPAIPVAAGYLRHPVVRFDLATMADNADELRPVDWTAASAGLPHETQHYVLSIKDRPAEEWADPNAPKAKSAAACLKVAAALTSRATNRRSWKARGRRGAYKSRATFRSTGLWRASPPCSGNIRRSSAGHRWWYVRLTAAMVKCRSFRFGCRRSTRSRRPTSATASRRPVVLASCSGTEVQHMPRL